MRYDRPYPDPTVADISVTEALIAADSLADMLGLGPRWRMAYARARRTRGVLASIARANLECQIA